MAEKSFILFHSVEYSRIGEKYKNDSEGNFLLANTARYLIYISYAFDRNLNYESEIGTKISAEIDSEIDQQNVSAISPIEFCKNHNDEEFIKIIELLNICKEDNSGNKYQVSLNSKRVMFLEYLKGEFKEWYRKNNLKDPIVESISDAVEKKSFPYGWLTERIKEFLEEDNCKEGKTVNSTLIDDWIIKLKKEGYPITSNTNNSIRTTLTRLGYTKEKR